MTKNRIFHCYYELSSKLLEESLQVGNRKILILEGIYLYPYNDLIRVKDVGFDRWCKVLQIHHYRKDDGTDFSYLEVLD